jgi:hypothetical protein
MSCFTKINVHQFPLSFDFPGWFAEKNYQVVATKTKAIKILAPLSLYTCVEGVKRILGVHNFWIFTPYQLYKYLTKNRRNK